MNEKIEKLPNWMKKVLGYATWILIGLLTISTIRNINRVISIRDQVEKERQKVERMKIENIKLEEQIAQAQGSEYIEKQIRNKLGLVKSGEAIVVLPDQEIIRKLAPQKTVEEDTLPDPNWKKWLKLFL